MPRGGSKKGEHRGNAKARNEGPTSPNAVMRRAVAGPKPSRRTGATVERELFTAQVIHGVRSADDMSPKQIMLDNMHCFQNAAYEYEAMAKYAAAALPDTEETRRAILMYEAEAKSHRRIASDEAYKVGPFIHPRYAAIAVVNSEDMGDDIVRLMLDEIDRRNREHPMVIEHEPKKASTSG